MNCIKCSLFVFNSDMNPVTEGTLLDVLGLC